MLRDNKEEIKGMLSQAIEDIALADAVKGRSKEMSKFHSVNSGQLI